MAADLANLSATSGVSFAKLQAFTATVQDQAEATKTALAELSRRMDEKDESDEAKTPDASKRACHEHYLDGFRADGTYTITTSGGDKVNVYCDMASGGWTLVGMVHTASSTGNVQVDEPDDWFTKGNYPDSAKELRLLETNTNRHNTPPLSYGVDAYRDYLADAVKRSPVTPLLKVEVLAQENLNQNNVWYKNVESPATFSTLFSKANTPSSVACRDLGMKTKCIRDNSITESNGFVMFKGMAIEVEGQKISWGDLHMRLNGDINSGAGAHGICSMTLVRGQGGDPNSLWADGNGHWGNAGRIWLH